MMTTIIVMMMMMMMMMMMITIKMMASSWRVENFSRSVYQAWDVCSPVSQRA